MKNRTLKYHLDHMSAEELDKEVLVFHPRYKRHFKVEAVVPLSKLSLTGAIDPVIVLSPEAEEA